MPDPHVDPWLAAFLTSDPDCSERNWIEAYATAWSARRPDQTAEQVSRAAQAALAREGAWSNPKAAAACDAVFGPRSKRNDLLQADADVDGGHPRLADIERRVADGIQRIADMSHHIAVADRSGHDIAVAREALKQMRRSLDLLVQLRTIVKGRLRQMEDAAESVAKRAIDRARDI